MKLNIYPLLTFLLAVSFTYSALASNEEEYKNMEQMMGAIHLEKKQVESMIDKMVAIGRISPEEGMNAKREIAGMKDSDLENLKMRAIAEIKNRK